MAMGAQVSLDPQETPANASNVSESWLRRTVTKILIPTPSSTLTLSEWIDQQVDANGAQWLAKYKADVLDIADSIIDIKEMMEEDLQDLIDQCGMPNVDSARLRKACQALGANISLDPGASPAAKAPPVAGSDPASRQGLVSPGPSKALPAAPAAPAAPEPPQAETDTQKLGSWIDGLNLPSTAAIAIARAASTLDELAMITDDGFDDLVQAAGLKFSQAGKLRVALLALGAKLSE